MIATLTPAHQTRPPRGVCPRTRVLEQRLEQLADAGPAAINDRLGRLDGEWSAGRAAKVTIGAAALIGFALAAVFGSWWLIFPAASAAFLLQHLFTRSSWLVKVFQESGYRTGAEIEHEKFALKALRGDFKHLPTVHDIEDRDQISRLEGEGGIVLEPEVAKVDPKVAVRQVIEAARH